MGQPGPGVIKKKEFWEDRIGFNESYMKRWQ